ncbi:MAG TPA: glycosyl hydrolase family 28-related protein, partial [Fimbriimonas sp.]|nr:glycosyl hydrolase family 28-related protein [Fimbriimonas sp.]
MLHSSSTSVEFVVPISYKKGAYAYQINTGAGVSQPQFLNVPRVQFIMGDYGNFASRGGWLELHGRCVGLPGGTTKIALVASNKVVAYLTADTTDPYNDMYRQRFLIPKTVPVANYAIFVHNGFGGPYGWTRFQTYVTSQVNTFRITNAPLWPNTKSNVAKPDGVHDDQSIADAISKLPDAGGVINLAPGTYKLSKPIVIPNHSTMQGAGEGNTVLQWTKDPMGGSSYLPLIYGKQIGHNPDWSPVRASFNLHDFSVVANSTYDGAAVDREYTLEPGSINNVSIILPRIATYTANVKGIYLRQTCNYSITNCNIDARTDISCRELVNNIRMENNKLRWREVSFIMSGNNYNFIFANNTTTMAGNASTNGWFNNDNPGFWLTTFSGFPNFSGAFSENLYYGYNKSAHEEALGSTEQLVGITFDGGDGIYYGGVNSVTSVNGVTTVNLAHATDSSHTYQYAGGVMKVESGKGAGQWAYIVDGQPNKTSVTINKPFTVPLDSTSVITIVNMQGNAIFDGNYFGCEPCNQNYYFSMDVIKANNTYATGGELTWAGQHYSDLFTDWHLQILNNSILTPTTSFMVFTTGGPSGYT